MVPADVRRPLARNIQRRNQRLAIPQHVEPHLRTKAAARHAEPRIARDEHALAAVIAAREHGATRAVVDRTTPCMGEAHVVQLRERTVERFGELVVGALVTIGGRIWIAAEVIAHTAAEDDPVVFGETEIIELGTRIVDALAIVPANARHLLVAQRCGRDDVIAHLHHAALDVRHAHVRRAGAKQHARRFDTARLRVHHHRCAKIFHARDRRVFVHETHTEFQRGGLKAPREFRRMNRAAAIARPHRACEQR